MHIGYPNQNGQPQPASGYGMNVQGQRIGGSRPGTGSGQDTSPPGAAQNLQGGRQSGQNAAAATGSGGSNPPVALSPELLNTVTHLPQEQQVAILQSLVGSVLHVDNIVSEGIIRGIANVSTNPKTAALAHLGNGLASPRNQPAINLPLQHQTQFGSFAAPSLASDMQQQRQQQLISPTQNNNNAMPQIPLSQPNNNNAGHYQQQQQQQVPPQNTIRRKSEAEARLEQWQNEAAKYAAAQKEIEFKRLSAERELYKAQRSVFIEKFNEHTWSFLPPDKDQGDIEYPLERILEDIRKGHIKPKGKVYLKGYNRGIVAQELDTFMARAHDDTFEGNLLELAPSFFSDVQQQQHQEQNIGSPSFALPQPPPSNQQLPPVASVAAGVPQAATTTRPVQQQQQQNIPAMQRPATAAAALPTADTTRYMGQPRQQPGGVQQQPQTGTGGNGAPNATNPGNLGWPTMNPPPQQFPLDNASSLQHFFSLPVPQRQESSLLFGPNVMGQFDPLTMSEAMYGLGFEDGNGNNDEEGHYENDQEDESDPDNGGQGGGDGNNNNAVNASAVEHGGAAAAGQQNPGSLPGGGPPRSYQVKMLQSQLQAAEAKKREKAEKKALKKKQQQQQRASAQALHKPAAGDAGAPGVEGQQQQPQGEQLPLEPCPKNPMCVRGNRHRGRCSSNPTPKRKKPKPQPDADGNILIYPRPEPGTAQQMLEDTVDEEDVEDSEETEMFNNNSNEGTGDGQAHRELLGASAGAGKRKRKLSTRLNGSEVEWYDPSLAPPQQPRPTSAAEKNSNGSGSGLQSSKQSKKPKPTPVAPAAAADIPPVSPAQPLVPPRPPSGGPVPPVRPPQIPSSRPASAPVVLGSTAAPGRPPVPPGGVLPLPRPLLLQSMLNAAAAPGNQPVGGIGATVPLNNNGTSTAPRAGGTATTNGTSTAGEGGASGGGSAHPNAPVSEHLCPRKPMCIKEPGHPGRCKTGKSLKVVHEVLRQRIEAAAPGPDGRPPTAASPAPAPGPSASPRPALPPSGSPFAPRPPMAFNPYMYPFPFMKPPGAPANPAAAGPSGGSPSPSSMHPFMFPQGFNPMQAMQQMAMQFAQQQAQMNHLHQHQQQGTSVGGAADDGSGGSHPHPGPLRPTSAPVAAQRQASNVPSALGFHQAGQQQQQGDKPDGLRPASGSPPQSSNQQENLQRIASAMHGDLGTHVHQEQQAKASVDAVLGGLARGPSPLEAAKVPQQQQQQVEGLNDQHHHHSNSDKFGRSSASDVTATTADEDNARLRPPVTVQRLQAPQQQLNVVAVPTPAEVPALPAAATMPAIEEAVEPKEAPEGQKKKAGRPRGRPPRVPKPVEEEEDAAGTAKERKSALPARHPPPAAKDTVVEQCAKSVNCSKPAGHPGKCTDVVVVAAAAPSKPKPKRQLKRQPSPEDTPDDTTDDDDDALEAKRQPPLTRRKSLQKEEKQAIAAAATEKKKDHQQQQQRVRKSRKKAADFATVQCELNKDCVRSNHHPGACRFKAVQPELSAVTEITQDLAVPPPVAEKPTGAVKKVGRPRKKKDGDSEVEDDEQDSPALPPQEKPQPPARKRTRTKQPATAAEEEEEPRKGKGAAPQVAVVEDQPVAAAAEEMDVDAPPRLVNCSEVALAKKKPAAVGMKKAAIKRWPMTSSAGDDAIGGGDKAAAPVTEKPSAEKQKQQPAAAALKKKKKVVVEEATTVKPQKRQHPSTSSPDNSSPDLGVSDIVANLAGATESDDEHINKLPKLLSSPDKKQLLAKKQPAAARVLKRNASTDIADSEEEETSSSSSSSSSDEEDVATAKANAGKAKMSTKGSGDAATNEGQRPATPFRIKLKLHPSVDKQPKAENAAEKKKPEARIATDGNKTNQPEGSIASFQDPYKPKSTAAAPPATATEEEQLEQQPSSVLQQCSVRAWCVLNNGHTGKCARVILFNDTDDDEQGTSGGAAKLTRTATRNLNNNKVSKKPDVVDDDETDEDDEDEPVVAPTKKKKAKVGDKQEPVVDKSFEEQIRLAAIAKGGDPDRQCPRDPHCVSGYDHMRSCKVREYPRTELMTSKQYTTFLKRRERTGNGFPPAAPPPVDPAPAEDMEPCAKNARCVSGLGHNGPCKLRYQPGTEHMNKSQYRRFKLKNADLYFGEGEQCDKTGACLKISGHSGACLLAGAVDAVDAGAPAEVEAAETRAEKRQKTTTETDHPPSSAAAPAATEQQPPVKSILKPSSTIPSSPSPPPAAANTAIATEPAHPPTFVDESELVGVKDVPPWGNVRKVVTVPELMRMHLGAPISSGASGQPVPEKSYQQQLAEFQAEDKARKEALIAAGERVGAMTRGRAFPNVSHAYEDALSELTDAAGCARCLPYTDWKACKQSFYTLLNAQTKHCPVATADELDGVAVAPLPGNGRWPTVSGIDINDDWNRILETSNTAYEISRPYEKRPSAIHGHGLFATEAITSGSFIVEYIGLYISNEKAAERSKDPNCRQWFFQLDSKIVIDANKEGSAARYMNHSCDPSCYAQIVVDESHRKHVCFFAARDIAEGEELCFDYMSRGADVSCTCGAVSCIGKLG